MEDKNKVTSEETVVEEERVVEGIDALTFDNDPAEEAAEEDDFVDPWTVSSKSDSGIDYDKLTSKYIFFLF